MPKVTDEHMETRRRQIMDAAFTCFSRKGFHPTTMQDICTEAQLSAGAVYRYFNSKEEIIESFCGEAGDQNIPYLAEAMKERDYLGLVRDLAGHYFSALDGDQAEITNRSAVQVWAEAVVNGSIRAINARNMEATQALLRELVVKGQREGHIDRALDPDALARVMVAVYNGFVLQKALEPDTDTDAFVAALVALFSGSLQGGAGQPETPAALG
ncbi:MAG: TetR/AcrR family transcriptional regulator [Dehalococcoidia bacterium]